MKKIVLLFILVCSVAFVNAQDRFALLEQQLEIASKTSCPGLANVFPP